MIELKQFDSTDFSRLINWVDSEKLLIQFAGPIFTFPLTTNQLVIYITDKSRFPFKVIETKTDEVIGHAEIYLSKNKSAKLCRILIGNKDNRGKRIGQAIVNELVKFSLNTLGATKIELNVFDWNTSAIKCYEKAGFIINKTKNKKAKLNNNEWTVINMILDMKQI